MSREGSVLPALPNPSMSLPTPFDAVAHDYDATFTETATGRMQRARVWATIPSLSRVNSNSALELNCGTGTDALWLARQGYRVLATDISPKMVAVTQAKLQAAGLSEQAEAAVLDLRNLSVASLLRAGLQEPPALIFSNFGGLNCVSPADLQAFGKKMPDLLAPGGRFVAVVMGRFCWQESLYFLWKGRWRTAFRRRWRGAVAARLDECTTVPTWYYTPQEFCRFFPELEVEMLRPVGFWLPPSYLDAAFGRWPRLLRWLDWAERKCERVAMLAGASDHFLVCFRLRPKT